VLNYNFAALNGDARPLATPAALRIPIDTCFTIDADPHPAVPTIVIRVLKYIDAVTRSKTNERTWKKSEPSLPKEIFTRKDQDLLVMIPIDEKNRKGMEAGFKLMRSLGIKILDTRKFGAESAFYDIFLAIDRDLFLKNFSRLPRDPMSTAAGATADSAFPCFVAPIVDMIHGLTINPL
jgi:hypothetical protein